MSGRRAKELRRKAKRIIDQKVEKARRLKIDQLVGPPPTVHQMSRALRRRHAGRI